VNPVTIIYLTDLGGAIIILNGAFRQYNYKKTAIISQFTSCEFIKPNVQITAVYIPVMYEQMFTVLTLFMNQGFSFGEHYIYLTDAETCTCNWCVARLPNSKYKILNLFINRLVLDYIIQL
jgi:hypothetical protein